MWIGCSSHLVSDASAWPSLDAIIDLVASQG
jgi:hypothetical protein